MDTEDEIVLVTGRVGFLGKAFFVLPFVEYTAFRVGGGYHRFLLFRWFLFAVIVRKWLFFVFFPACVYLVEQLFRILFLLFGSSLFGLLFQIGNCLNVRSIYKMVSVSRYPSSTAAFSTQRNTYATVAW